MGLYRGDDVSDASQSLYQKALDQMLLPAVAMHVTTWLRNDNGSDVEYSYEALKAYQMLYQPKHYDGKFLHFVGDAQPAANLQKRHPVAASTA